MPDPLAPVRLRMSRAKGWRLPPGAVNVARPTRWGNPYRVGQEVLTRTAHQAGSYGDRRGALVAADMTVEQAVAYYRAELETRIARADTLGPAADPSDHGVWVGLAALAGHDLACWCPLDRPCHADVLLELANGRDWKETR